MKNCETLERMLRMSSGDRDKAGKFVARSLFRILAKNGFSHSEVMGFAGHLLDEVMRDMRVNGKEKRSMADNQDLDIPSRSKEVA